MIQDRNDNWILMLSNDSYQIDRRIVQEAETLIDSGYRVLICYFFEGLPLARVGRMGLEYLQCGSAILPSRKSATSKWEGIKSSLASIRWILRLYQFLLSFKDQAFDLGEVERRGITFRLVFAHDLPMLPLAVDLKERGLAEKVVFDAHEQYEEQLESLFSTRLIGQWRKMAWEYIPKADALLTVTAAIGREMEAAYHLDRRFVVLTNAHNFISRKELAGGESVRTLYGIEPDKKIVLCCGGITPGRNLEDLIYSATHFAEDVVVCFLGYGHYEYLESLKRLIDEHKVKGRVYLGKAVTPENVVIACHGASLGVITNRGQGSNNEEGAPNRLYEYIQSRTPVLSYSHKGVNAVLAETGTGWVRSWKSPLELAEAIAECLLLAGEIPVERLERAAIEHCWEAQGDKFREAVL